MMFRITNARLINIPIMTEIMNFLCFRLSECLALISLSTTFFLFLHTRELNLQLVEERQRHSGEETSQEHFHSRDLSTAPDSLSDEYFEQVSETLQFNFLAPGLSLVGLFSDNDMGLLNCPVNSNLGSGLEHNLLSF